MTSTFAQSALFGFRNKIEVVNRRGSCSRESIQMFAHSPLQTDKPEQTTPTPNYTNQLLNRVEEFLIENSALTTALEVVERLLPPEAQEKVRSHIEDMRSDPALRDLVSRRFAQYRDPSVEGSVSELLEQDLAKGIKSTGALLL